MHKCNAKSVTDVNLLQQVLRQGESLRNSIIQTIYENEPFHKYENIDNIKTLTVHDEWQETNFLSIDDKPNRANSFSIDEKHRVLAYMKGDPMSKSQEQLVLDTFRSLSSNDICELTSRSFTTTQNTCGCSTCRDYCKLNSSNLLQTVPMLKFKSNTSSAVNTERIWNRNITNEAQNKLQEILEYVDSIKIALHSFIISDKGKLKILENLNQEKSISRSNKSQNLNDLNVTYFIEYEIPRVITLSSKKLTKVDSGLNTNNNVVKKCSKNIIKDVVYFKQVSLHDVENLHNEDLNDVEIVFKITCRVLRQKKATDLGVGKFNLGVLYSSPTLSTTQEVVIYLEGSPIVTGSLKIQIQFGCNKLYFGKNFIDSVLNKKKNCKVDSLSSLNEETFVLNDAPSFKPKPIQHASLIKTKESEKVIIQTKSNFSIRGNSNKLSKRTTSPGKAPIKEKTKIIDKSEPNKNEVPIGDLDITHIIQKTILFGFIYISRVEYSLPYYETYFTCQPFCQNDFVQSNIARGGLNPYFNFIQVIPYIYDDEFVFKLRENHMIIEFFEQHDTTIDKVIGISKIPLHQYYLAYRNPIIIKYLERNKQPVIGTDWYEPIVDVSTGHIVGNYQILVALGTESQVKNLQKDRGFMDDIVTKAKRVIETKQTKAESKVSTPRKQLSTVTDKKQGTTDKKQEILPKTKKDKKLQTEIVSTPNIQCSKQDRSTLVTPSLSSKSQLSSQVVEKTDIVYNMDQRNKMDNQLETIQNYLQQLVALKSRSQTESEPNTLGTEQNVNNLNEAVPSTTRPSNLLDSFQSVMNLGSPSRKDCFKAQIVVESALHLPVRKKYRVKKIKGKTVREELLPSTYVSYEIKDGIVKTSQVVQKSTSPKWNMKNEVSVPVEYLTNSNHRLLFKVWKKSNNGSTIPNMQIDTIIGFATVDLTVLLAGLPTIEGWFNIMDLNNKCNGQIKINVTPLENITKFINKPSSTTSTYTTTTPSSDLQSSSLDAPEESISRALKRKFIELDEITQRLKSRLNHITSEFNEPDDTLNDESADEFEKDINTLCVEEDYDLLDFAKEAQDMNMRRVSNSLQQWQEAKDELVVSTDESTSDIVSNPSKPMQEEYALQFANHVTDNDNTEGLTCFIPNTNLSCDITSSQIESSTTSSSVTSLDRHLTDGKERIDDLLQKLMLISSNSGQSDEAVGGFNGRYVSGCSTSHEAITNTNSTLQNMEDDILTELGIDKDFDASKLFDASLEHFNGNLEEILGRIERGNIRDEPDGEGNTTESNTDDDKLNND